MNQNQEMGKNYNMSDACVKVQYGDCMRGYNINNLKISFSLFSNII